RPRVRGGARRVRSAVEDERVLVDVVTGAGGTGHGAAAVVLERERDLSELGARRGRGGEPVVRHALGVGGAGDHARAGRTTGGRVVQERLDLVLRAVAERAVRRAAAGLDQDLAGRPVLCGGDVPVDV